MQHLVQITNKAKALDIPIVDLYGDDLIQGMQQLGEYAASHPQLIFAGQVTPIAQANIAAFAKRDRNNLCGG